VNPMAHEIQISQRSFWLFLAIAIAGLYGLAGIMFNPFILWVSLPFYIAYGIVSAGYKNGVKKQQFRGMGYLAVSLALTYLYHLTWFFDWDGTKTSSSSSAIIFFIFPIYIVLIAFIGYFLGPYFAKVSIAKP